MRFPNVLIVLIVVLIFCLLTSPLVARAGEPGSAKSTVKTKATAGVKPQKNDIVGVTLTVLDAILAKKYGMPEKYYSEALKKTLPASKLKSDVESFYVQVGAFKKKGTPRSEIITLAGKSYDVVVIPCRFEKTNSDFRVVFDKAGKITELAFTLDS